MRTLSLSDVTIRGLKNILIQIDEWESLDERNLPDEEVEALRIFLKLLKEIDGTKG